MLVICWTSSCCEIQQNELSHCTGEVRFRAKENYTPVCALGGTNKHLRLLQNDIRAAKTYKHTVKHSVDQWQQYMFRNSQMTLGITVKAVNIRVAYHQRRPWHWNASIHFCFSYGWTVSLIVCFFCFFFLNKHHYSSYYYHRNAAKPPSSFLYSWSNHLISATHVTPRHNNVNHGMGL